MQNAATYFTMSSFTYFTMSSFVPVHVTPQHWDLLGLVSIDRAGLDVFFSRATDKLNDHLAQFGNVFSPDQIELKMGTQPLTDSGVPVFAVDVEHTGSESNRSIVSIGIACIHPDGQTFAFRLNLEHDELTQCAKDEYWESQLEWRKHLNGLYVILTQNQLTREQAAKCFSTIMKRWFELYPESKILTDAPSTDAWKINALLAEYGIRPLHNPLDREDFYVAVIDFESLVRGRYGLLTEKWFSTAEQLRKDGIEIIAPADQTMQTHFPELEATVMGRQYQALIIRDRTK
jgi:hypothetical protein